MMDETRMAVLEVRQAHTELAVDKLVASIHDDFAIIHTQLDTINATINRQRGATTVIMMGLSALGALLMAGITWMLTNGSR